MDKIRSLRLRYEKRYFPKIRKALKSMLNDVTEYMKTYSELHPVMLDVVIKTDKLEKALFDMYKDVGVKFAQVEEKELLQTKAVTTDWESFMRNYALIKAGEKVVSIKKTQIDTFLKLIKDIQIEAAEQGYGVEKTASYLRRSLNKLGIEQQQWQARRIVQTEVLGSSNYAQVEAAKSMPFETEKVWSVGGGKKTQRHLDLGLDNMVRDIDIPFEFINQNGDPVSMQYPGDTSINAGAKDVCNCNCIVRTRRKGSTI